MKISTSYHNTCVTLSGIPAWEIEKGTKAIRNVVEGLAATISKCNLMKPFRGCITNTSTPQRKVSDIKSTTLPAAPLSVTRGGELLPLISHCFTRVTLSGIPAWEIEKGTKATRNVVEGLVATISEYNLMKPFCGCTTNTSTSQRKVSDIKSTTLPAAPLSVTSGGELLPPLSTYPTCVTLSGIPAWEIERGTKAIRNVVEGLAATISEYNLMKPHCGYTTNTSTSQRKVSDIKSTTLPAAPLSVTSDSKSITTNPSTPQLHSKTSPKSFKLIDK